MKKFFGFSRKKGKPSGSRSGTAASSLSVAVRDGYDLQSKDLGKLHRAAAKGNLEKLQQLVKKHDLNLLDKANRTPLHLACASGCTEVVMFLVDNKCRLNLCDNDNRSPLMKAVQCQQEFCASYLLQHGADPNVVDFSNNTALHCAASNSSISIAEQLLVYNAKIDAQNKDGNTPLILAVSGGNQEMTEFLLKKGASVNAKENTGRSPLMTAASNGDEGLINLLIQYDANVSDTDTNGWTAEDYAVIGGHSQLSKKLSGYGRRKYAEQPSSESRKGLSEFSSSHKDGGAGLTLGAPATNKEDVEMQQSQYQAAGNSGKVAEDLFGDSSSTKNDDSWCSDDEDLFSPEKPQKQHPPELVKVYEHFKKYYNENDSENNELAKDIAGAQNPIEQELKDPNDSYASSEEEEGEDYVDEEDEEEEEEEGFEEEDEDEEEETTEDEEEEEIEDDYSQEKEDEDIEEGQGKLENEECFEKSEREQLETSVDSELLVEQNCGNRNSPSRSNKLCSVHNEVQKLAGRYESSDENLSIKKMNNGLPHHSLEEGNSCKLEGKKMNNYECEEENTECQNPNEFQDTEENEEILDMSHQGFHKDDICSSQTFEVTTSATSVLSSLVNKGKKSNLGGNFESDDDPESKAELEKQNSKNISFVDYQSITEKLCNHLQEPVYEPLVDKWEQSREENLKEDFRSNIDQNPLQDGSFKRGSLHDSQGKEGTEDLEHKKKLMEELGLDETDHNEDESDWDSSSIPLSSVPCADPLYHLVLGSDGKSDSAIKKPEVIPVGVELSDTKTMIPVKGGKSSEQTDIKGIENDENKHKDKNVVDAFSCTKKSSLENQTDNAEVLFACEKKETEAAVHTEESNSGCSQFGAALWEERYEKMWVANEKREVKTCFKSITAELKQKFGETNINVQKSNTSVEERSQDGFSGMPESPLLPLSKTTIDIQATGDSGNLNSDIAEKKCSPENLTLNPINYSSQKFLPKQRENGQQNIHQNQSAKNEILSEIAGVSGEGRDNSLVQLETDVGKIASHIKPSAYIDTAKLLSNVTKSAVDTILYQFNNGASRRIAVSNYKNVETEIGKKVKKSNQSCCQISKERDKEVERDVVKFKNEVGIVQTAFLALEKENAQLRKEVEEKKQKQKWEELEAAGKMESAAIEKRLAVNTIKQKAEELSVKEKQYIKPEGEILGQSPAKNLISSMEIREIIPVAVKGTKDVGKSESKQQISKQWVSQQITENPHQQQDDSSLNETSEEEVRKSARTANGKNKIPRTVGITNTLDDLTQSSDTAAEDIDMPVSVHREADMLIEQLGLENQDSVSLLKIRNIVHGYEHLIGKKNECYAQLQEKVKKNENEKKELQRILEEMGKANSLLDHQKVQWESDISSLKFFLKQTEEKKMSVEMQYEKSQEQLRKKEEQYHKLMEEKQKLELTLRSLEVELRTLKNNSKRMADPHDQEKDLLYKNQILQDELAALRLQLDQVRVKHQEEAAKYLEENEGLKGKNQELKKELKLNEEALSQTVLQYNGQINVTKTELAILTSKLEHMKEDKEQLEVKLDSFHSRLNSITQELEQTKISKNDLERTLEQERDEWVRLKNKLNHDLLNLQETNNSMSQLLSKTESKTNSLENELHHVTHTLREKNLLIESIQRDLSQAQCQVKELENAWQIEKGQVNKHVIKQESVQERLTQLQSENILLRQQLEDFQNQSIIKERVVSSVQDRFNDIFAKLRADTEKQVQMIEERNKELTTKCNNLKDQVSKYETEKAKREGSLRELQQELADSLKKQSMAEAALEVTTDCRNHLEEDKRELQKEIDRVKSKHEELEEQFIHSQKCTQDLRNDLDVKEGEARVVPQNLQELLVASSGTNTAIKHVEEHMQRLEVENARLQATNKGQTCRIEMLQKDLQGSASVHSHLEELVTILQTTKINLEEQLNHQVQKQAMLSTTGQDTHKMWEEELKLRSKLQAHLSELDKEKTELLAQFDNEKKKVKKLAELKRSVEIQLGQEMKRNNELQKECNGIKKLLKTTEKKLKERESGENSSQREMKTRYSDIGTEVGNLRKKTGELSHQLKAESSRCTQLESTNRDLQEQLSSVKTLHKKLERSKLQLEDEVANLRCHVQSNMMDYNQREQYKREVEERARQEVKQKLEEVNLFLQTQTASQETLEQIRATNNTYLKNQLELRIGDLESELARLKNSQQDNSFHRESTHTELERYKELYLEELKIRKSLGSKLDRANEKLSEANAMLLHESQRNKSLLASSFVSGSLSASPILEIVQFGNLSSNLALNRTHSLGGGFMNPSGNALSSKNKVEAYVAKMRMELDKHITRELDQATVELDAGSLVGAIDGSSKKLNREEDQVTKAAQEYLDVLKKNYMI